MQSARAFALIAISALLLPSCSSQEGCAKDADCAEGRICSSAGRCAPGGDSSDDTTSGAGAAGSVGSTGAGPQACNDVANDGPVYYETETFDPMPAPAGGVIADGRYHQVAEIHHKTTSVDPPSDPQFRTLQVTGNTWQLARREDDDAADSHATWSVVAAGAELTATVTCPADGPGTLTYQYTATSTQLTLFNGADQEEIFELE